MGMDCRGSAVCPQPTPILNDGAFHAASTSPLVCLTNSSRPSALTPVTLAFTSDGRLNEVDVPRKKASKGGDAAPLQKRTVYNRVLDASAALIAGAMDPLLDGKFVFMCSHGITSIVWYNALTRNIGHAAGGDVWHSKTAFTDMIDYTAFAEVVWVDGTGYQPSGSPFTLAHLKGINLYAADESA